MLNTEQGVTPHAFLPGKLHISDSLRDIKPRSLARFVAHHLCNSSYLETPFSSWTPDLATALHFATGNYSKHSDTMKVNSKQCYIAVLDTWKMYSDEERPFHIVPVAKIGQPACGCEYLVYGPVRGPAYTVVRVEDIQKAVGCPQWPYCATRAPMPHSPTYVEMQEARTVSNVFNGCKAMRLTIFLAEICRQQWCSPEPGQHDRDLAELSPETMNWNANPRDLLEVMVFLSGCTELIDQNDTLPLFNARTHSTGMGQLQLALNMMHWTSVFLRNGFAGLKNRFKEEKVKPAKSVFYLQGPAHDCSAPSRDSFMSLGESRGRKLSFLRTDKSLWPQWIREAFDDR